MLRNAMGKFSEDEDVQWRQADASSLPFSDQVFEAMVCQFGLMFVPDKALAAREAHRVLKPGGLFLFNVWDAIEHNALFELARRVVTSFFEKDPPTFYEVPYSYHDQTEIERLLKQAGYREIKIEVVAKMGQVDRAEDAARGLVNGNPVALAIAERDSSLLPVITDAVTKAMKEHFGETDFHAPMRAIVVQARA